VLIDETGNAMRALLCDFGFARAMLKNIDPAANSRKLKALTICGTDDYMAPEVIMGMPYNEKVDVFSYGIVLLELITRKKAEEILLRQPQTGFDFDKEELRAALVATDKEQQRKYPGQDPCPPLFAELFFACCAYNPQDRPGFKDIIVILAKIAKEAGAPPATPPPVAAPIQIHHKPGSKIASNPNPNPNDTTHTSNPNTNTGTSTSNASTLKIVNSNSEILSEQQAKNKFTDLQDAVQLQLDNMAKIVSTLEAQILEITNEKDIMKVKPQCRIIIEMKEYLNGIVNAQSVIIPPVDEPTDSSRFGLFKKTISQSIAQIRTHLQYLKGIVADGSKYAQLVTIAKTVRQIKKTLEELNYANN
jgi:serine/threonine protein kinase